MESDDILINVRKLCPAKDDPISFDNLRNSYNAEPTASKLWALMLSSTNNMLRFSGGKNGKPLKYNQTFGKRSINPNTEKKTQLFTEHIRQYKDNVKFISKHFNDINITVPSMNYLDPPYGRIEDNKGNITNTNISEAGYNAYFTIEDDLLLYDYIINLDKNKHSFMVSGLLEHADNKSWMLSKLIRDSFNYKELVMDYNKVSRVGDKISKEIIIYNY